MCQCVTMSILFYGFTIGVHFGMHMQRCIEYALSPCFHSEVTSSLKEVVHSAQHHFRTVPDSMFTLFVLMNGEDTTGALGSAFRCEETTGWTLQEWPDVMPLLDASGH